MRPYPKKRLGQHFLVDEMVIDMIVNTFQPKQKQKILEIGPGHGALTIPILEKTKKMDAIEIDVDLIDLLQKKTSKLGTLTLHQQNAIYFSLPDTTDHTSWRVIGNLPYNSGTAILLNCVKQRKQITDMFFMLQKEVAERICAPPGEKSYGRISILVQLYCKAEILFFIEKTSFFPEPKVTSAMLYLCPRSTPLYNCGHEEDLTAIVKQAFLQRRKKIKTALSNYFSTTEMLSVGIDPNKRPEALSIRDYAKLALLYQKRKPSPKS